MNYGEMVTALNNAMLEAGATMGDVEQRELFTHAVMLAMANGKSFGQAVNKVARMDWRTRWLWNENLVEAAGGRSGNPNLPGRKR